VSVRVRQPNTGVRATKSPTVYSGKKEAHGGGRTESLVSFKREGMSRPGRGRNPEVTIEYVLSSGNGGGRNNVPVKEGDFFA